MKKTIIITMVMLAVCAATLVMFAGQLENAWQEPQENDINLTSSSPVEQVEQQYKELGSYPFIELEKHIETLDSKRGREALEAMAIEHEAGMISYEEAAYYGGMALENLFPTETFTDKQFVMIPLKRKSPHMEEKTVIEGMYQIENPLDDPVHPGRLLISYAYWIDAYTGEVIYVSRFEAETDVNHKRNEQQALEYAANLAKAMGYDSYSKYNIESAQYNPEIDAMVWGVELLVEQDKSLSFSFNDLEDNFFYAVNDTTSKFYQLVVKEGISVQ